jgi:serine/threonine protein phosphatase PrpC
MRKSRYGCAFPLIVEWNQGPRDYQEDYFGVHSRNHKTLLVLADGMGGHSSGDLASRWTVEHLIEEFKNDQNFEKLIERGVKNVLDKMKESGKDMGCTLVVALLEKQSDHYQLTYSWIGDSRIYITGSTQKPTDNAKAIDQHDDTTLWLLSDDDSFVWGFYLNQEITIDQLTQHPNKNQLEYSIHPRQENVHDILMKRIRTLRLNPDDKVFLCSDGIWESFETQAELIDHINGSDPKKSIQNHLKRAIKEERFNDNGTYILAEAGENVFDQQCVPTPVKKRFWGSCVFAFLSLCLFTLIFLVLIGEFDSAPPSETDPVHKTETAGDKPDVTEKSGPNLKSAGLVYVIQVGSFSEYQQARSYSLKFSSRGYPVEIFETLPPDSTRTDKVYLVRIGSYPTLEAAQVDMKKLEAEEKSTFSIASSSRKGE